MNLTMIEVLTIFLYKEVLDVILVVLIVLLVVFKLVQPKFCPPGLTSHATIPMGSCNVLSGQQKKYLF